MMKVWKISLILGIGIFCVGIIAKSNVELIIVSTMMMFVMPFGIVLSERIPDYYYNYKKRQIDKKLFSNETSSLDSVGEK